MVTWLRFRDLKARRIVNNWVTLRNRIERDGFPPGRMLGPNDRAWTDQEIADYLASRPVEGPPPRGIAAAPRGRPRKPKPPLITPELEQALNALIETRVMEILTQKFGALDDGANSSS